MIPIAFRVSQSLFFSFILRWVICELWDSSMTCYPFSKNGQWVCHSLLLLPNLEIPPFGCLSLCLLLPYLIREFLYLVLPVHMLLLPPTLACPLFSPSTNLTYLSGSSLTLSSSPEPSQTTLSTGFSPELLHNLLSSHHSSDN